MKTIRLLCVAAFAAWLGQAGGARAEDIDLYSANPNTTGVPNVLFVIDTGANFSSSAAVPCTAYAGGGAPSLGGTAGGVEQCALVDAISALPEGTVNIGLMVNNGNGFATDVRSAGDAAYHEACSGTYGGCLVRNLTLMTAANKTNLINFIKSWKLSGSNSATEFNVKSGGDRTANMMQEAWAYYNGKIGMSGKSYADSILNSGCQKNFIIFIGNAFNTSGTPADTGNQSPYDGANALTSAQVGATAAQRVKISETVRFNPATCGVTSVAANTSANNWSENWADEWSRLMYQQDGSTTLGSTQNIVTYTIGVVNDSQCKPDYPALLTTMAKYGGGKYFKTSSATEVKTALDNILNEVQAVNSVFSAASLPVSVNAQGTYLNQIFLGMFRPDASGDPRWLGNLKQYQFILDANGSLQLGDSTGAAALSAAGTGFITPSAISFWTNNAAGPVNGFFVNDPKGAGGAFDSPDGEFVEKGGVAQVLRNSLLTVDYTRSPDGPRRLYTYCPSGSGCNAALTSSVNVFATSNNAITTNLLGVADSTARAALINWVRGENNRSDDPKELGPGGSVNVRPSIHGDVLHSRPVVVNYGDSRGLVVFYGANDGVFRAVNASQTDPLSMGGGTVPPGGELWGLILPEHYGKLARQRSNTPEIIFPAPSDPASPKRKDYFVDGPSSVYQKLLDDRITTDKAYLYLTMRRGGRFMYALDVTTPTAPTVMWKISSSDSGFSELGQTWSRPRVALVKGYSNPVLIFGAGYDPAEDAEPPNADTMGRGIFIVDAFTGARVWSAVYTADVSACSGTSSQATCAVNGMNWAVPSDLSLMDRDRDGYTDRIYAPDLGGNIWRVDLEPGGCDSSPAPCSPDRWQVTKFAALGCDAGTCAAGTTPRKFFYPPTVVSVGDAGMTNSYDAVLLGSGDREHPLKPADPVPATSAYAVTNRFYMLKDTHVGKDATTTPAHTLITESMAAPEGLFDATTASYDRTRRGYYVTLATGEKVVNAPTTVSGQTFFGTNQPVSPSPNSCASNLGIARGYALNPFTSIRSSSVYDGGGLPPSPVAGVVSIRVGDQTVQQSFCMGCGGGDGTKPDDKSSLGAFNPSKNVPKKPRRTYWYKR